MLVNDLLLLIVPAYAHKPFAEVCAPHLRDGHMVVITPGRSRRNLPRLCAPPVTPATLPLPKPDGFYCSCSCKTAPDTATIWGVVSSLGLGVYPATKTETVADALEEVFTTTGRTGVPMAIAPYPNVLACGLCAMNRLPSIRRECS